MGPALGDVNGGLTVDHVVTRSVRDSAALLDVLAGPMPGDPYYPPPPPRPFLQEVAAHPGELRIGYTCDYLTADGKVARAHPDCVAAVERAAALLADLGHKVEEGRMDPLLDPNYVPRFLSIWFAGVAAGLAGWGEVFGTTLREEDVEPCTWALAQAGNAVSSATYLRAWTWLQGNSRMLARLWKDFDIWITPTLAEPPVELGAFDAPANNPLYPIHRAAAFAPFTPPLNASGQPAISLPLYTSGDGLPIGVQLIGAYAREDLLLRVAAQLEEASPFSHPATM
jgi:amidase